MALNVVIPAHNEGENIHRSLEALSRASDLVEPIVASNASTDNTAEIAESYGVQVIDIEDKGKMPAIQEALRSLGPAAMDGFVILDADSQPIMPRAWANTFTRKLGRTSVQSLTGPAIYDMASGVGTSIVSSARFYQRNILRSREHNPVFAYGRNMGVRPDAEVLDYMLSAPNVWPGEDLMKRDLIVEVGGGKHEVSIDPRLFVLTSARGLPSLRERLRIGSDGAQQLSQQRYQSLTPEDGYSYEDIRDQILAGEFLPNDDEERELA